MIDKVTIRAFKGIDRVELELAPVTVLVGANGSGKSSVLEGIRGLRAFAFEGHATEAMKLARATGRPGTFVARPSGGGPGVEVGAPSGGTNWVVGWGADDPPPTFPAVIYSAVSPRELSRPSRLSPEGVDLQPDGSGLAAHVTNLRLEFPQRFDDLVARLRRLVPAVRAVRSRSMPAHARYPAMAQGQLIDDTPSGTLFQLLFDFEGAEGIPQAAVSAGTLAATYLLAQAEAARSAEAILLVDDVETGLHPAAQLEMMGILRELAADGDHLRVVVTTHSPYVVDAVEPSTVWVLGPGPKGGSVARRLDSHPDAKKSLEVLTAGEFWGSVGEDWVGEPA